MMQRSSGDDGQRGRSIGRGGRGTGQRGHNSERYQNLEESSAAQVNHPAGPATEPATQAPADQLNFSAGLPADSWRLGPAFQVNDAQASSSLDPIAPSLPPFNQPNFAARLSAAPWQSGSALRTDTSADAQASSSSNQATQPPAHLDQASQPYEPLITFPEGTRSNPRQWELRQGPLFVNPHEVFSSVPQRNIYQAPIGQISQSSIYQGPFGQVSQVAGSSRLLPQAPQSVTPQTFSGPASQPATNRGSYGQVPQSFRGGTPLDQLLQPFQPQEPQEHSGSAPQLIGSYIPPSQAPQPAQPSILNPQVPQAPQPSVPSTHSQQQPQNLPPLSLHRQPSFLGLPQTAGPRLFERPQLGEDEMSLPSSSAPQPGSEPPPMPEIPPPMPSIFSGRLRGTWHYEAKLPDDTMTKFLVLVGEDRERAKAVKSAKFSLVNDALHNTGLIHHFNDCLLPYTLTDDNSDGPYPILTDAALRMKAYQRDLIPNAPARGLVPPPVDHVRPLNVAFLEAAAPFAVFVEMYLDLFVQSFPNLEFFDVPEQWIPHLIISPFVQNMWKEKFGWEIEVKHIVPGRGMRLGKKGGWNADQCAHWFQMIAEDIERYG